ncbi:spermatogenesis-associated serine-rich protein 1-like [Glandiceps talaboti]
MSVQVTTEIGKPGRRERERRHFPESRGEQKYRPSGRVYIPHGQGEQPDWKPHGIHLKPRYTEFGPDWKSRLRYIPPPRDPNDDQPIIKFPGIRYYPYNTKQSNTEWSFYPDGYHAGRRCLFEVQDIKPKIHMSSTESSNEVTHSMLYGKKRPCHSVWETRGGMEWVSPGDKSYQISEYSPNFHHDGSTRPVVNFGGELQPKKPDTFVPLQQLPPLSEPYFMKERKRQHCEEVCLVQSLENYRASSPLLPPPLPDDRKPIPASFY